MHLHRYRPHDIYIPQGQLLLDRLALILLVQVEQLFIGLFL